MKIRIGIDKESGFCFGVQNAVHLAEEELQRTGNLYCLGSIVHNQMELGRLRNMGLKFIGYEDFKKLKNVKVLIRAHGEPPEIYSIAHRNGIKIIDATCPIVAQLQAMIRTGYQKHKRTGGTVVIFGKKNHPEVKAHLGQTEGNALVVNKLSDLDHLNFKEPISLYSQTTMSKEEFEEIIASIAEKIVSNGGSPDKLLHVNRTICRQVINREEGIKKFAEKYEIILFASSRESSNGRVLFGLCQSVNTASYFITKLEDLDNIPLHHVSSIGICGATSTPGWFLEKIKTRVTELTTGNKKDKK
jgi:4-hydroxy-3-methylbut-2-enyl diphosphate reductase